MKKMIIAISLLVIWAGNATAAGTTNNENLQLTEQSNFSTPALTNNVSLLLEENTRLRFETELLQTKVEELSTKLDYSNMMHISITTLKNVVSEEAAEEVKSKIAYMQMMHVTLMNLNKILVENN